MLLVHLMKHTDPSPDKLLGNHWQILGELEVTASAEIDGTIGGWLADRIGGAQVLSWVFGGVAIFSLLLIWPSMVPFTVGALGCAGAALVLGGPVGRALLALAVCLPGLLVQDCWRFAFMARGTPRSALLNDGVWAMALVPLLGAVIAGDDGPVAEDLSVVRRQSGRPGLGAFGDAAGLAQAIERLLEDRRKAAIVVSGACHFIDSIAIAGAVAVGEPTAKGSPRVSAARSPHKRRSICRRRDGSTFAYCES